jgi:hypothetical protein
MDHPNGVYLNWTSSYLDGSPTGRSGRVDFELSGGGTNAPDEYGSGGMTRRLVLADKVGSCANHCNQSDLWNQTCVTGTESGQLPGVPLKGSILLYVARFAAGQGGCNSWERPFFDDFVERSGAAGMLNMWTEDSYEESGRDYNQGEYKRLDALAPAKTLEYWRSLNQTGPEPLFINELTVPYASIFSGEKAPYGDENVGGLTMRRELEAGLQVHVFWPGTGPIKPEERLALKQLVNASSTAFKNQGHVGLSHAEFLADDSIDPCLHRLDDTACIGGHIVQFGHAVGMHKFDRLPCDFYARLAKFTKLSRYIGPSRYLPSFAFECAPNERVVVPCAFWQLEDMVYLKFDSEPSGTGAATFGTSTRYHFETCGPEMEVMPNLLYFDGLLPDVTGTPPPGLFRCPRMESFRIEEIQFEIIPSLDGWPKLKSVAFINNNVSSPLPSFANKPRLQDVVIQGNPLQISATGGTAGFFDNCAELSSVIITDTDISELFRFVGSTKLVNADLSHNQIDSTSFPESWNQLKEMKSLDLSFNNIRRVHNFVEGYEQILQDTSKPMNTRIYEGVSPLLSMTKLLLLDLSHNEILEPWRDGFDFVTTLVDSLHAKGVIENFDVSHNKFFANETDPTFMISRHTETYGSRYTRALAAQGMALTSFSFHHNSIAGYVNFYDAETCKYNFDGSYNRLSGIVLGIDVPCTGKFTPSMRYDISNQVYFIVLYFSPIVNR